MIGRVCYYLLLLVSIADAHVDFNHSRIFDEYDFKGKSSVNVDSLCKNSCRIFASITPESKQLTANILIQLPKGFVSIAEVAAKVDPATNLKSFVEVNKVPSLAIVNGNKKYDAGPLVLYIVRMDMGTAEVYEAGGLHRSASKSIPQSITVMSATPFTLKQAPLDGPQGVHAVMGGFDAFDGEPCPELYYARHDPFPAFTMEVNGPIISIIYDYDEYSTPPAEMTATIGISKVYRSSLYDTVSLERAEVTNSEPERILVDVATKSHADHAVILTDEDSGKRYSVSQTGNVPYLYTFNTKNLTIDWKPEGTGDSYFLVRWNSTIVP
ncbi:hypothetical protein PRIPAC_79387 [Pristionchus pacificus]|uniref:Uncharacterized protein n=1 Tax=Pristionchus pacificus TaxID=54126 RepID=A0A2A6CMF4_PRIPA|nr:hypothetical protein PRIPAC_79387 [Pristionchus pacificus]|eukprot:PDM79267.1 hypothetical protein PRIPAC_31846 [Pristionchus pacificus]